MPSDNLRLEGDPNDLIRALDRATSAWNAYNRNLVRNIELSQQVAVVTLKVSDAFRNYTGTARSAADQQQRVSRNLSNSNRSLSAAARNTERLSQATRNYQASAASMNASLGRTVAKAGAADSRVQKLSLSLQSMARLVAVQLVHRAISGIARALAEGVRESIEIQKSLAEVRTISQSNQLEMEEWFQGVKRLSSAYGVDFRDQIEGVYQALSNQVAEGAESFQFLASSNRFAAAAVSTTTEAVQLLTGTLNAYGFETNRTDQVAAQFFKTIELGRVRASEMANSFGDIAILANQLGLGLDETQAAVSTLTIRGVAYNKAATQLRGIFVKLLKPTEKMKEFFKEIGVNSGEAAIRTFGFDGVLQKLNQTTKGSATELAKYVNRVRGLSGALALSNEGLETYKSNLEEIRGSTESYGRAVDEVMNNSGKRADIFLQTVKNAFTELGNTVVEFYATWAAENTDFFKRAEEERARLAGEAKLDAEVDAITIAYENGMKDRLRLYDRELAEYNAAIHKQVSIATEGYSRIQEESDRMNKAILRGINDQISASEKRYKEMSKNVADAAKQVIDITREGEQTLFDWAQETRNTAEKIAAVTKRISALQLQQSTAWVTGNKKAFDEYNKEIRKLFETRFKLDRDLQKENEKNLKKQKDLTREIAKVKRDEALKQAALDAKLQGTTPAKRGTIEKQIHELNRKTAEKVTELRSKLGEITVLDRTRLNHTQLYSDEIERQIELTGQLADRQKELAAVEKQKIFDQEILRDQIKDLFKQYRSFKFGDAAAETDPEKLRQIVQERQKLIDQILTVGGKLGADVSQFTNLDKAIGVETKTLIQRAQLIEAQTKAREGLTSAIDAETKAMNTLAETTKTAFKDSATFQKQVAAIRKEIEDFEKFYSGSDVLETLYGLGPDINIQREAANSTISVIERLKTALKTNDIAEFKKDMLAISKALKESQGSLTFNTVEFAKQILQARVKADKATLESVALKKVNAEHEAAKKLVERIRQENKNIGKELNRHTSALSNNIFTTNELIERNERLLRLLRAQTTEINRRTGNLGGNREGNREGGDVPIQQAFGDVMRGSDNMLALRQRGEGVINAKNTRRFFSQISAMNATPQATVTQPSNSTSIGDINVTMNATGNLNYDAATLGQQIKRAARRGLV